MRSDNLSAYIFDETHTIGCNASDIEGSVSGQKEIKSKHRPKTCAHVGVEITTSDGWLGALTTGRTGRLIHKI